MLESGKRVGLDPDDFIIACLDEKSYESLKDYSGTYLYTNQEITEYQDWSFDQDSSFRKIVRNKWKIIEENYIKHKELCWVDTDIVFVQNPLPFIENKRKVLFQTDEPNGSHICSGFMVFNDTEECSQMIETCSVYEEQDDQLLINHIAPNLFKENYEILEPKYFPNGQVYYVMNVKEDAVIVHNNWMVGVETKIKKFKDEGLWYV
jgi:hypothetical protein